MRVLWRPSLKKWLQGLGWLLILAVMTSLFVLVMQNQTLIPIDIFVWHDSVLLPVLVSASFIAGVIVAGIFLIPGRIRQAWHLHRLKRNQQQTSLFAPDIHFKPIEPDSQGKQTSGRRSKN